MTLQLCDPKEADLGALSGKTVAVIGYGNQGHAHALNLRDSGVDVIVGQRDNSASHQRAMADGFAPMTVREAVSAADLLILTLPDEAASAVYTEQIAQALRGGQTLGFVHGFNVRYGLIDPPSDVDCVMVAPKGPGSLLRSLYVEGKGLPVLMAIERNPLGRARATALAWAKGIGATRAGIVQTTFAVETETDLFGEQVVLCGGVAALMKAAFETLVEAGYEPEIAYIECVHELKQVVDLVYQGGLSAMRRRISNTAKYGDLTRGPRVVDDRARREMRRILDEVKSGAFAEEWMAEYRRGMPELTRLYEQDADSAFERAGQAVRKLW